MNARQKRFCDEYLIDCNAVQAALRAGFAPKTARYASQWINERNLQKPTRKFLPKMRAYIDERLEALQNAKTADAQEILEYLTSVMRGESRSEVVVVESVGDGTSQARLLSKPPDEKERLKAAELLGRRYGVFTDKVSLDVQPVVIVNDLPADTPDADKAPDA